MPTSNSKERIQQIKAGVEAFCDQYLTKEYFRIAKKIIRDLPKAMPESFQRGKTEIWSAAVIEVIASANFLHDKAQPHCLPSGAIHAFFGTNPSSVHNRSRTIKDALDITPFNFEYLTKRLQEEHPFNELDAIFGSMAGLGGMASSMPNNMASEMLSTLMENMQFEDVDDLNAFMQEKVVGKRIDDVISDFKGGDNPQIKSMQLLEQAQQTMLPHKAKKLIQEALKLDPSNGDAYVLLASMERSPRRAMAVLKKGVEEAKKGIHDFEEIKGHFWGFHHTRPYMRVRQELADLFYELKDINEAIRHYQEMIQLNPNDNQGLRYKLGVMLVENGSEKAYFNLRDAYPEGFSACWSFTYAFYLFKKEGNSVAAKMALREAHNQNKFVIPILAQVKPFPAQLPGYYGIGDENEAAYAVLDLIELIDNTEGLLDWVSDFAVGK